MRDDRRATAIAFLCALLPTLILPALMPKVRLVTFAPFLILLLYRKPLTSCLWWAIGVGCLIDLLSGYPRLGLLAIAYSVTVVLLYLLKPYFSIEKMSTLPLMTALFAILSSISLFLLLGLFGHSLQATWSWIVTDLLIFPLLDSLYGLLWFIIKIPRQQQRAG